MCLRTSDNEETTQVAGKTVRLLALGIVMQPSPDAEVSAPGDGSQETRNKDYIQTSNEKSDQYTSGYDECFSA